MTAQPAAWPRALLRWFDRHRRPMPWRDAPTPYRVWVSEIMLQQTQVATVRPYFDRFLERFPTPAALAAAEPDAVLHAWEGLGYYRRARNLHAAARLLMTQYGGQLPDTTRGLRTLPGIGDYSAAAIASIAFGEAVPAIDGNVMRVMTRLLGIRADSTRPAVKTRIRQTLASVIPARRAGDFNQALMELGALVCRPRQPACAHCPLRSACRAAALGLTARIPKRPARKAIPSLDVVACVIQRGDRVLLARRRPDQMLGGLWEFPGGKQEAGETEEACAVREIREELGIAIRPVRKLGVVPHAFSHFRIRLHVWLCRPVRGRARALTVDAVVWTACDGLSGYAMPAADRKALTFCPWMAA